MRNVRRRLQVLERLFPFQPAPNQLDNVRSLALQRLSQTDLEMLHALQREQAAGVPPRELSEAEAAACAAWATALEVEARRTGFISYAGAERIEGGRL